MALHDLFAHYKYVQNGGDRTHLDVILAYGRHLNWFQRHKLAESPDETRIEYLAH